MLDSFDYKEPACSLCGGKEFYNPNVNTSSGRIPIGRIIYKLDECFNKNNYVEAERLLEYWVREAVKLNDLAGELSIQSELVGFYRKVDKKEKGLKSINRAIELIDLLQQGEMSSGATIYLNCATAYKAFGFFDKAIALYERAEKIYMRVLTACDERFGGLYNNMALTLADLGMYDKAEASYKKAIELMSKIEKRQADLAITYVNMAHLYEQWSRKDLITDCMFKAYNLLNADNIVKNGYFAYVLEKCAPSFEYFGYGLIAKELNKISGEIYERS